MSVRERNIRRAGNVENAEHHEAREKMTRMLGVKQSRHSSIAATAGDA